MNSPTVTSSLTNAADDVARIGTSVFESWVATVREMVRASATVNPLLQTMAEVQQQRTQCHIPPACWLPRDLGEVRSFVCPGGKAVQRIRVTNCQPRSSRVQAAITKSGFEVDVTPDILPLNAMERGWFTATVTVPVETNRCEQFEFILWLVGCNTYYLRWIVEVDDSVNSSCHEIEVDDCPDHIHHWYDHFYCVRPCFGKPQRQKEK